MQTDKNSAEFRFQGFEVNLSESELRKDGSLIHLQEKPFRFLVMLLENAGRVVARARLREGLWPADTFVDFDRNLNAAVKRLREVLGDSARTPQFIQTLPRKGYRFIAPVERIGGRSTEPGSSEAPRSPKLPELSLIRSSRRWLPAAVTILAALSLSPSVPRSPSVAAAAG
jgi:DNA-binding winged helix-turn-helix (wHTH) protein